MNEIKTIAKLINKIPHIWLYNIIFNSLSIKIIKKQNKKKKKMK